MNNFSWTCPHCNQPTTITNQNQKINQSDLFIDNQDGHRRLINRYIVCPNTECRKTTLELWLHVREYDKFSNPETGDLLKHWQLIPSSSAKSFPNYVPQAIIIDYDEACQICDLSPKASATLSRRCLQGILRDFWKVKPGRLVDEINQIEDKVDPLVWEAIDSVRKIGNIGAHMEKDINVIVDVEPEEAELLIGLIEMLIREWYILREERKKKLEDIKKLSATKQLERKSES
jgi:hypothetical protein